ncbi:MLO-like protein 6 [Benincasa hispida]|uniref:MLO-like protein 6 n=1 Tax=Benincasa hispida TaxID=102211 RepID=UPI0019014A48|nr:MLO-like protein 6 [Benincasa hispida]
MAAAAGGKSLEQTPTWAVAVVCFVLLAISIFIEYSLHLIGHWLKKRHKRALFEALEKIKSELMLLGFISLLLTVGQGPITEICIPEHVAATWHPCTKEREKEINKEMEKSVKHLATNGRRLLHLAGAGGSFRRILAAAGGEDKCAAKGQVSFISAEGIHQLHIFIFVLAVFHVLYCVLTYALARAKMRSWKTWEKETKTAEYQFSHDPERFRFARDTSFGRRHLSFWTKNPALMWIVCFFRQFVRSVPKVDYLTLRHGFIMAHLAPQSHTQFDFQKYINRSLEEDFKVVVGIRYYTALIKCLVLLVILFYFFEFQYEFGLNSCFHEHVEDVVIRISMGVIVQILCSYVTLPLYALVTQMGSTMKPTIFNERVAAALRNWYHSARKHIKHNRGSITPMSSRPATPTHNMSPVHLLRYHRSEVDSFHTSPRRSPFETDRWDNDSPSPSRHAEGSSSSQPHVEMGGYDKDPVEPDSTQFDPVQSSRTRTQHEIHIGGIKDFSFDRVE